jgi:thiol:disulfide interchange protein DsbD
VGAHADGSRLHLRWIIADGYYLYRNKFEVASESPDLRLGTPSYPPGTTKSDPFFGNQVVYTQQVDLVLPYARTDGGAHPLQIRVTYQGCAEAGLCYPPMVQVLFPDHPVAMVPVASHPWEAVGILGGIAAFFAAGWSFRRAKRPAMPA